jgi:hypothetical protein
MLKNLANMIAGAIIFAGIAAALASTGTPPLPGIGFALQDGQWLLGLAGGSNFSSQSGITAAGTNQATATQLAANIYFQEVDTAGSGGATGVALPSCLAGSEVKVLNNTAYTFDVYPNVANNPITATQDVIVTAGSAGTTSTSQTTYTGKTYTCFKNGVWLGK